MSSRLHLFEFADQPWFPRYLADAGTAYLATLQQRFGLDALVEPHLRQAIDVTGSTTIVDLCSGGGGPLLGARARLPEPIDVRLTDLRPNAHGDRRDRGVEVYARPVDATDVPSDLTGLRTVFNALHHFKPDDARAVLKDAQSSRQPILVVELSERAILPLTIGSAMIPWMVLAMMPLVRPVRIGWLLLTYLLPVLPLYIAWDGWVSHWRTYAPTELEALVKPLHRDDWTWSWGRDRAGPGHITWLLGHPQNPEARENDDQLEGG